MKIKLLLVSLLLSASITTVANAAKVHGALGSLVVLPDTFYVTFDNNYAGCGNSKFYLSRPDWNDIKLLAQAVQQERVVIFEYECRGQSNWITHFRFR